MNEPKPIESETGVLQRIVRPILVFPNLNIACFNAAGEQIPELQKSIPTLLAEHAEKCGYDLTGAIIETRDGNWKMFRTEDGGWNHTAANNQNYEQHSRL